MDGDVEMYAVAEAVAGAEAVTACDECLRLCTFGEGEPVVVGEAVKEPEDDDDERVECV